MKRGVPKSKDRQAHPGLVGSWTKNREVTRSYTSLFKKRARHYGITERIGDWLNGEAINPKTAKTYAILFLAIAIIFASTVLSQGPLFHQTIANPSYNGSDPFTTLWHNSNPTHSLSGFTCVSQVTCYTTNGAGLDVLQLRPNSTQTSVALSTSTIDLSTSSSKVLLLQFSWVTQNTYALNKRFGWYLTTNKTLPTQLGYDPYTDPNVELLANSQSTSANVFSQDLLMLKTLGASDTVSSEDPGGCSQAGSPFVCGTGITMANHATAYQDWMYFLNFTGAGSKTTGCTQTGTDATSLSGPGCSWYFHEDNFVPKTDTRSTQTLPWVNFQAQQFYLGFYVQSGFDAGTSGQILFTYDQPIIGLGTGNLAGLQENGVMAVYTFTPATGSTTPPTLDTGGFFGPIIKALISLGVYILGAILTFVGYLANLIITAMNVVGNFLGIGPFGTNMVSLFSTILGLVSAVFVNFFTWASNIATTIGNAFLALAVLLSTYFTQIGAFFAGLVGFLTFLWTVVSAVLQYGSYPVAFSITVWWVWGMFAAYDDGIEGFLGWVDMSEAVLFKGLNVLIWFGEETMKGIARLRTILPRPAGI